MYQNQYLVEDVNSNLKTTSKKYQGTNISTII